MACLVVVNCPINMDPNWTLPLWPSFHTPCNLETWKFFPSPGGDDDVYCSDQQSWGRAPILNSTESLHSASFSPPATHKEPSCCTVIHNDMCFLWSYVNPLNLCRCLCVELEQNLIYPEKCLFDCMPSFLGYRCIRHVLLYSQGCQIWWWYAYSWWYPCMFFWLLI